MAEWSLEIVNIGIIEGKWCIMIYDTIFDLGNGLSEIGPCIGEGSPHIESNQKGLMSGCLC